MESRYRSYSMHDDGPIISPSRRPITKGLYRKTIRPSSRIRRSRCNGQSQRRFRRDRNRRNRAQSAARHPFIKLCKGSERARSHFAAHGHAINLGSRVCKLSIINLFANLESDIFVWARLLFSNSWRNSFGSPSRLAGAIFLRSPNGKS